MRLHEAPVAARNHLRRAWTLARPDRCGRLGQYPLLVLTAPPAS